MKRNLAVKAVAVTLGVAMCVGTLSVFAGCANSSDTLTVMMSDAFDGLFNPFFSTSSADSSVVEMTQIGMLTTDEQGNVAYGDNENVVVKDYSIVENADNTTTYYFVLKNGILFSDGVPLTMNDVLFNMYVYLDPVYTGSSTMYSTDIVGLQAYRTQQNSQDENLDATITNQATGMAQSRLQELSDVFTYTTGSNTSGSYDVDEASMKSRISSWNCSVGYLNSIGAEDQAEARKQLLADYEYALETFKAELETDYESAREAYTEEPYKSTGKFDEIVSFMYAESSFTNFVEIEYEVTAGGGTNKNKITKVTPTYPSNITTKEAAINYVFETLITNYFHYVLAYYATGTTMLNTFISKAKGVILHVDGELTYKNISGIVSLGHSDSSPDSITVNGTTYKVAKQHNTDGTPANSDEYDVLSITINGIDPKAIWNFAFQVAPYHYYSDPDQYPIDIENNQFGVERAEPDFMSGVLQGTNSNGVPKNKVPVGAGPYVATDVNDGDNPTANGFYNNNYIYYKANENFMMGTPKIQRFRYKYVSSSNAIGNLKDGSVDFIEPQYTTDSLNQLKKLASDGIESVSTWQLGYGYIGINAGKVKNINLRKAIMSAMNTALALQYYDTGTAVNIAYPMSVVSWAYPRESGKTFDPNDPTAGMKTNNGHSYMQYTTEEAAKQKVQQYMAAAGVSEGDSQLKITFTIAGSNLTEHPLYNTFVNAMQILNDCGWNVTVSPDTNALVKLSTGSLAVWAAAWSSTVDPDMYQVYHKDSTATSVLTWGYREILASQSSYPTEYDLVVNKLSPIIEKARETNNQTERTTLYEEAMGYVLDLAVEMPAYQRKTLYAYNSKVINADTFPETLNSYSSPLSRIWELELK